MTGQQASDEFVAQYNGQYIDEDRYYGSQCWDVVARYAREKWGCPSFPTGSGGAEGLFRLYQNPIPQYFDKVSRDDLQPGDIVVWSSDFYPPWGHTALVWRRDGNTLFVLEQDGSKDPNGDGIADGVSYIAQRIITSKVAGGLRPKGANMEPTVQTADEAAELFRGVFMREPTQDEINSMIGRYWKERIVYLRTSAAGQQIYATYYGAVKNEQELATYKLHASNLEKDLAAERGKIADLQAENAALKQQAGGDPNSIVITSKGWAALWTAIKSFFAKNN